MAPPTSPLSGLTVLDFTRLLPGPLGTRMLAQLGAHVIKIEHPDRPDYIRQYPPFLPNGDSANFQALNHSKQLQYIAWDTPEGRSELIQLIQNADILVEQYRPGQMAHWQLDYHTLAAINPRLIYVSITGYGQTGEYAQKAGHDLNFLAYSGILSLNTDAHGKPILPGIQLADIAGGSYMLLSACLTGVIARYHSNTGQHIDLAMLDALLPMLAIPHTEYLCTQNTPNNNNMPLGGLLPNYNVYLCADGQYIALAALELKFWERFCIAVDQPQWIPQLIPTTENITYLHTQLTQLFATKTRAEWLAITQSYDCCLSPVLTLADLPTNTHLQARSIFQPMTLPSGHTYTTIGIPFRMSQSPLPAPTPCTTP
jgi:alpha-methylacyl-CoA racemase